MMRCQTVVRMLLVCGLAGTAYGQAAPQSRPAAANLPAAPKAIRVATDSGPVSNASSVDGPRVVYSTTVFSARAGWMRLWFGDVLLSGDPETDRGSYLL